MRTALVVIGLTVVFIASLLLIAKPPANLLFTLPSITEAHNVPYFLYLKSLQHILGLRPGVVMLANAILMWLTLGGIFRAGWRWSDARFQLGGATLALVLVQFHPLAIVLPLTLGFLGGSLMVPLLLMVFVNTMLWIDHWSAFMRAIMLAVTWSLFLWVHLPTAVYILVAMALWVLYSRRPTISLGIFLTVFLLGSVLFSTAWTLGCLVARQASMIQGPISTVRALMGYFYQGLTTGWVSGSTAIPERLLHITAWLSPFLLILGLWVTAKSVRQMVRERRANTADFTALIALVILIASLTTSGKDVLPGAWHLLAVVVLWAPLIARSLAQKENFYSRGFRLTFLAGFLTCGVVFVALQSGPSSGLLVPSAGTLLILTAAMAAAGAVLHALLNKHPLTLENRIQALLTGSTLAYFLVVDGMLFR